MNLKESLVELLEESQVEFLRELCDGTAGEILGETLSVLEIRKGGILLFFSSKLEHNIHNLILKQKPYKVSGNCSMFLSSLNLPQLH